MNQPVQTPIAELKSLSGNIITVTVRPGAEIDMDAARELTALAEVMLNTEIPYSGFIFDLSGITYIYDQARDHLANGDGLKGKTVGIGLISHSSIGKMNCNLFVILGRRAGFPVKVFESAAKAEHWLRNRMNMVMGASSAA